MKSNFSKLSVVIALIFVSCNNVTISTGDGSNKITGNGKVVSEVRETLPFNAISVEGVFNVTLKQGNKESVMIEADENFLPVIVTIVENDTLKVKIKDSTAIRKMNKLNMHITLVSISSLNTAGVGSLECLNKLNLQELNVNIAGVGGTALLLEADKLSIKSEIVGALSLSGKVKETTIDHNGVGVIKAFNLKSEKLKLNTNGVGAAEVFASQEIIIDASGIGGVQYKGGAAKKQINNNGIGKVICADCK